MKKFIISIICTFLIFFNINTSFAKINEECPIIASPSTEISDFLKNTRKIISNINSELNWQSTNNSYNKSFSELISLWNSIISWDNYFLEFNFKVREPLFNNVPRPILRDNELLTNEINNLNRLLSNYAKKWYLNIKISSDKICNWVENCNLKGQIRVWNVIIKIIDSIKNIRKIIQEAAVGKTKKTWDECSNLIWISKTKCDNIFTTYINAKNTCVDDSKKESILKIWLNFDKAEKSIQKWKDAITLLMWNDTENIKYEQLEEELLKKELAKQWLSWNQAQQILDNLKEYNHNWWYSLTNNPISNIIKTVTNSIDENQLSELEQFKQSIIEVFKWWKKEVSISKLNEEFKNKKSENITYYDIDSLYKEMTPLAKMQDLDSNQILREITNMNIYISQANNTLEEAIPLSQKTCKQQKTSEWWICE